MTTIPTIGIVIPSWSPERAWTLVEPLLMSATQVVCRVAGLGGQDIMRSVFMDLPDRLSAVEAMVVGETSLPPNIKLIAFLHDDFSLSSGVTWTTQWPQIISHFSSHPRCGLAGFGGGLGFGHPDIYKVPYGTAQLARTDFISNMRDAEAHGRRVTKPTRVAALDGFSLIVTREFYEACGGWQACLDDGIQFHMYDGWISARAAELGYEVWMLPVACHHEGGATSVGMEKEYLEVVRRLGYRDGQDLYDTAHRRFYERFRRVLPIVPPPVVAVESREE